MGRGAVLTTGANSGIGLATVIELARRGFDSVGSVRSAAKARAVREAAAKEGVEVRLLYDAPRRGTAGSRINFIHPKDAGGVLIELVQPAGGAH